MPTWSIQELADIFELAPNTIRTWVRLDKLHGVKIYQNEGYRISDRSLFEFFRTHEALRIVFMYKLEHNEKIGNKDTKKHAEYLHRKGYI